MPSYHRNRMSKAIQRQLVIHVKVALLTDSFPLSACTLPRTLPTGFSVGGGEAVAVEVNVPPLLRGIQLDLGVCLRPDMTGCCSFSLDARSPTAHQSAPIMPCSCVAVSNTHLDTGRSMIICP